MKTSTIKPPAPTWYTVDAEGQVLGRIAAKIAKVLRGKHRPSFSPHQLCGDHIIVLNVEKLSITASKLRSKIYRHHTGFLGHMQERTLEQMLREDPRKVMDIAVKGMLAKTRLRPQMLKRLHVYVGTDHPYAPQKPVSLDLSRV
jgi:large subunit ribosomal protein L13